METYLTNYLDTSFEDEKIELINSISGAIKYILDHLENDNTLLYSEKESLQTFLKFDAFKQISFKDFQNFLNQIQHQKNNINH